MLNSIMPRTKKSQQTSPAKPIRVKSSTKTGRVTIQPDRKLVDPDTGEIFNCQVFEEEASSDCNFHKVWIEHIQLALGEMGEEKAAFMFWLFNNLDKHNRIVCTQRNMAEQAEVALSTVNRTLVLLAKLNYIKSPQRGVYVISPEMIFKGSHDERMAVLHFYHAPTTPPEKKTSEQAQQKDLDLVQQNRLEALETVGA